MAIRSMLDAPSIKGTGIKKEDFWKKALGVADKAATSFLEGGSKVLGIPGKAMDLLPDKFNPAKNVGVITGAVGSAIGGAVGAIGTPIANIAQGKPVLQDLGKNIMQTAKETGQAATMMGEEGTREAPLAFIGEAVASGKAATALEKAKKVKGAIAEKQVIKEAEKAMKPEARFMKKLEKEGAKKTPAGLFKEAEPVFSKSDKNLALKFKDQLGKGSYIDKENAMRDYISSRGDELQTYLEQNDGIFSNKVLESAIKKKLDEVVPKGVKESSKKDIIITLMSKIEKNNYSNLWKARSKFDKLIDNLFSKDELGIAEEFKVATRDAVNDFIEQKIPESLYKAKLKDLRDGYRVLDRVKPKASAELGKSRIQKAVKDTLAKHPYVTGGAAVLGGQQVISKGKQILGVE